MATAIVPNAMEATECTGNIATEEKKSNNYLFPPPHSSTFPKKLLPQNTPTLDTASLSL